MVWWGTYMGERRGYRHGKFVTICHGRMYRLGKGVITAGTELQYAFLPSTFESSAARREQNGGTFAICNRQSPKLRPSIPTGSVFPSRRVKPMGRTDGSLAREAQPPPPPPLKHANIRLAVCPTPDQHSPSTFCWVRRDTWGVQGRAFVQPRRRTQPWSTFLSLLSANTPMARR
jgi:hypothetical protein